jgi:hypothetical protein
MKACNGTLLNPIKGSHLITTQGEKPAEKPAEKAMNRYLPPSKRKDEVKTLTKEDIDSDALFPSLSPMKPMTSGASWSQIRTRLSRPTNSFEVLSDESLPTSPKTGMNFINVIEERLKREKAEMEEETRRSNSGNPGEMTTFHVPPNQAEIAAIIERLSQRRVLTEEDYYNAGNTWDKAWAPGDPVECVHLGGAPVQRTEKYIDYFAEFAKPLDTVVTYSPISESSVTAAKNKFFAFLGKRPKVNSKL